ncbi:MAG: hypothetical protein HY368_02415 [Candidatus Aenigmarchaeota archaeon]|nr:hypothetical protein [Candidatus Aenigmarchaeota archaeon]
MSLVDDLTTQLKESDVLTIQRSSKSGKVIVPGVKTLNEMVLDTVRKMDIADVVSVKTIWEKFHEKIPSVKRHNFESALRVFVKKHILLPAGRGLVRKGPEPLAVEILRGSRTGLQPLVRAYLAVNGLADGALIPGVSVDSYFSNSSASQLSTARQRLHKDGFSISIGYKGQFLCSSRFFRKTGHNSFYSYRDRKEYIMPSPNSLEILYLLASRGPLTAPEIFRLFSAANGNRRKDILRKFLGDTVKSKLAIQSGRLIKATRYGIELYRALQTMSPLLVPVLNRKYGVMPEAGQPVRGQTYALAAEPKMSPPAEVADSRIQDATFLLWLETLPPDSRREVARYVSALSQGKAQKVRYVVTAYWELGISVPDKFPKHLVRQRGAELNDFLDSFKARVEALRNEYRR